MKKFISAILALCMLLSVCTFAAPMPANPFFSERDMIEDVGSSITNFGVYSDFSGGQLYLETLIKLVEANPDLYTDVMKALLSSVDKYGAYYTPNEAAKLLESLSDTITGIGVSITLIDGNLIISRVLPNTPAEKAGLQTGDRIISANGVSLSGMDLDTATSYIKGAEGTTVSLVVNRSGAGDLTFNMVREKIITETVGSEIIDNKIGYIEIYSFSTNTALYVNSALGDFRRAKIKKIIIDVRNNTGGYLDEAIAVADLFLPAKKVITSEDRKLATNDKTYVAKGQDPGYEVVVLMNEYSASASEVLAAALSENDAATLIGTRSYGKGTVQTMYRLADGGLIKYTTAFYLTPDGKNIEGVGLVPDIYAENKEEDVDLTQFTELKYKHTYSLGMTSPEIKNAKEMLAFLGVYQGEINEYYDENLKIAVTVLQKSTDYVAPTGVLDPVTQIELLKALSEAKVMKDNQLEQAKQYLLEK